MSENETERGGDELALVRVEQCDQMLRFFDHLWQRRLAQIVLQIFARVDSKCCQILIKPTNICQSL